MLYAPEHCQILSKDPEAHLPHITNASEVLLGEYAAGSLANYMMGPNCVLPTSAAAHIHSPLGVMDFMKMSSVGKVDKQLALLKWPQNRNLRPLRRL